VFFQYFIRAAWCSDYEKLECTREHYTLSIDALKVAGQRANCGENRSPNPRFKPKFGQIDVLSVFGGVLLTPHHCSVNFKCTNGKYSLFLVNTRLYVGFRATFFFTRPADRDQT